MRGDLHAHLRPCATATATAPRGRHSEVGTHTPRGSDSASPSTGVHSVTLQAPRLSQVQYPSRLNYMRSQAASTASGPPAHEESSAALAHVCMLGPSSIHACPVQPHLASSSCDATTLGLMEPGQRHEPDSV